MNGREKFLMCVMVKRVAKSERNEIPIIGTES
jgi:hypothetical protein